MQPPLRHEAFPGNLVGHAHTLLTSSEVATGKSLDRGVVCLSLNYGMPSWPPTGILKGEVLNPLISHLAELLAKQQTLPHCPTTRALVVFG